MRVESVCGATNRLEFWLAFAQRRGVPEDRIPEKKPSRIWALLRNWGGFVKFSHTLFALPFALAAMALAARAKYFQLQAAGESPADSLLRGWPGWRVFLAKNTVRLSVQLVLIGHVREIDRKLDDILPVGAGGGEHGADIFVSPFQLPSEAAAHPLPFLFGMPPDKAVRRYQMSLLGQSKDEVWIRAFPRWKQDAVNYREATVILDANTYLPKHVRLTAPDNTQTIYSFFRLKVNSKFEVLAKAFGSSPFRPNLKRYRVVASQSEPIVPSVIGMPWKKAQKVLTTAGYKVKFTPGVPATKTDLTYVIYQQTPRQQAALAPGSQIRLTFFAKPTAVGSKQR